MDKTQKQLIAFAAIIVVLIGALVWRRMSGGGAPDSLTQGVASPGIGEPKAITALQDTVAVAWESQGKMDPMKWPRDPFSGVPLVNFLNPKKTEVRRSRSERKKPVEVKTNEVKMLPAPEGITLNGILSNGSTSTVIINGKVLREKDSVPETGLTVEKIEPLSGRVILSGKLEKYFLE